MDEKTPDSKQEYTKTQVVLGLSAFVGAIALIGFGIWFGVVLTRVAHTPDPEAEMANRPVFRRVYKAYDYVRGSAQPSFAPEREFVMPNGAKKRPDGTWSAPTKPWPVDGEINP